MFEDVFTISGDGAGAVAVGAEKGKTFLQERDYRGGCFVLQPTEADVTGVLVDEDAKSLEFAVAALEEE
jgi:hypothetical protein